MWATSIGAMVFASLLTPEPFHSPPHFKPLEFTYGGGIHHLTGVGKTSVLSDAYIRTARPICLVLLKHAAARARSLARDRAGSNIAARMAMMAITTSSSIRVNAGEGCPASGFF